MIAISSVAKIIKSTQLYTRLHNYNYCNLMEIFLHFINFLTNKSIFPCLHRYSDVMFLVHEHKVFR